MDFLAHWFLDDMTLADFLHYWVIRWPLSVLFPVRLPRVDIEFHPARESWDAFEQPITECGILWRAYDVRLTGIEKNKMGLLS